MVIKCRSLAITVECEPFLSISVHAFHGGSNLYSQLIQELILLLKNNKSVDEG